MFTSHSQTLPGISIHSLRMEGDGVPLCILTGDYTFQSTPSAWRETAAYGDGDSGDDLFQSTSSAWRETALYFLSPSMLLFQSTPSAWRETFSCRHKYLNALHFNPLPPHGGRRQRRFLIIRKINHFNPLPPHGGRPTTGNVVKVSESFQSTPSAWRETECG